MNRLPIIVDQRGTPIRAQADTAHLAASRASMELAGWFPQALSADGEWLKEMDVARARTQDLIRNNGMINGAVQTQVDNLVGAALRLSAKPDWKALGIEDVALQAELEDQIESAFRQWAHDRDCYCDASRHLTFGGIIAQGVRSYLTQFEIVATGEWLPRPGSKYATAIQMIDPLRLSNPTGMPDSQKLRAGVVHDDMGAAVGYFFSSRVPSDTFLSWNEASARQTWKYVPRETPWGRRMVIHVFDQERPGQSRGKGGILSVLARGRMLDKNEQAHLQAAIQNAMFATVVTSPMGWESIGSALGAGQIGDENDPIVKYVTQMAAFHKESTIRFAGTKIPHLYPGEDLKHIQPSHPHASFESFERIFHRYMAAGMNMTYEQFTKDYSQTNYSGHRAALLDYWRFVTGRRSRIADHLAGAIYALVLEEIFDRDYVEIPAGAPGFLEAKTAWTGAEWIGPGRGQIDPLKEANATKVEYSLGLTTLEIEAAERGRDWRELIAQRAQEIVYRKALAVKHGIDENELRFDGPTPVQQPPDQPEGQDGHDAPPAPAAAVPAPAPRRPSGGAVASPPLPAEPQQIHVHAHIAQPAVHVHADTNFEDGAVRVTVEPAQVHATVHADGFGEAISALAVETRGVSDTLNKPVVPIYGDDGKIIGARRYEG